MASTIYGCLLQQSENHLCEFYENEWCALAVFQSLGALSRTIIMRLVFQQRGAAFSYSLLEQFVQPTARSKAALRAETSVLKQLKIIGMPVSVGHDPVRGFDMNGTCENDDEVLVMNTIFYDSLNRAISAATNTPWEAETAVLPPLSHAPRAADVEQNATQQWNAILHFLVGTADAPSPSPKMVELLVSTGLLAPGAEEGASTHVRAAGEHALTYDEILHKGDGAVSITRAGYEFLLRDTSVQLWTFLGEYLATAESRGMRKIDVLSFLLQLGFCEAGAGYAVSALSSTQQDLLDDFASFGLVYVPEEQEPVQADQLEVEALAEAQAGGSSLDGLTAQSALASIVSLLLHSPSCPNVAGVSTPEHASPATATSPVRWIWPVLRSIYPADVLLAGAADESSPAPAVEAAPDALSSGWGFVEEPDVDMAKSAAPSSSTGAATVVATTVPSAPLTAGSAGAGSNPAHTASAAVPPRPTSGARSLTRLAVASESPGGRFSLLDAEHGSLRPALAWVPNSPGAAALPEPDPSPALRALGGALQGLLRSKLDTQHQHISADCRRFYPSSLAVLLARPQEGWTTRKGEGAPAADADAAAHRPVVAAASLVGAPGGRGPGSLLLVVEKNFKVYGYTRQDLHLALLALFCQIDMRLPDVVVATLTRKSVLHAMRRGLSADLISHFLAARIHPSADSVGVPENVRDQLFLWEQEESRVIFRPAYLLTSFSTLSDFASCSKFVGDHGGALFDSAEATLAGRPALLAAAAPPPEVPVLTSVWSEHGDSRASSAAVSAVASRGHLDRDEDRLKTAALVISPAQRELVEQQWVGGRASGAR